MKGGSNMKRTFRILSVISIIVVASACDKFLDTMPDNRAEINSQSTMHGRISRSPTMKIQKDSGKTPISLYLQPTRHFWQLKSLAELRLPACIPRWRRHFFAGPTTISSLSMFSACSITRRPRIQTSEYHILPSLKRLSTLNMTEVLLLRHMR